MTAQLIPLGKINSLCNCPGGECGHDHCVNKNCGTKTPYKKTDRIEDRKYYVEGAGQLCRDCWNKTYNN